MTKIIQSEEEIMENAEKRASCVIYCGRYMREYSWIGCKSVHCTTQLCTMLHCSYCVVLYLLLTYQIFVESVENILCFDWPQYLCLIL